MAYDSFKLRLIYVFSINDEAHRGCLKVGETSLYEDVSNPFALLPNSSVLNRAANKRIQQYTSTAGIRYTLHHTELTASLSKGKITQFNDKQVHQVLLRSGIKKKIFDNGKKANEWFICSLEEVKAAIQAAKEGRNSINVIDIEERQHPIEFRPEQEEAIRLTIKRFHTNNQFLWNAKMRFGKTLSALQVVKEMGFDRTLILTHRPVVDDGWFEDFGKIFFDNPDYYYGSRTKGEQWDSLQRLHQKGKHYVYFVSIQDLRGSEQVGGNFDKNAEIFSTDWDLLIVDEAHEGTKTALGQAVLKELFKGNTKMLQLSGTPFNLFDDYKEDEIYTWDYVMEQRAKADWDKIHWGDPNPYAALPKLNIYTFDLSLDLKQEYQNEEHAFNFAEFFRVKEDGTFLYDSDVDNFLNLLASNDAKGYPYSKLEWRQNLRHTLWTVPSVAAAKALSVKIKNHPVLGSFQVVNVAGDGDTDADFESKDALNMVREAITDNPEDTYTITLSRGRLTTGVSVPAWTAVLMLHGSYSTSSASYMQTIFRAQTPATIGGKIKEECYVFDFAPDRTLKVLAETAKVSAKAGKTKGDDRKILGEFLNFCPVISFHGAQMQAIDVDHMMQQLKRVYVDRVVRNGFEDVYLYNDRLMQLSHVEMEKFANLRGIIGQTKAMKRTDEVDINKQGFTNEEYAEIEHIQQKKKKREPLTPEEQQRLKDAEEKKKQRNTAISILRGISIRMPMILYGADIKDEKAEITLKNFTSLVDDQSWVEFMPKGVTKELFEEFIPYYDEDIFAAAGLRIRNLAREADAMDIEDRIERIVTIFSSFRNPDKETVLTPWRVVNMQLADTLGGWCFFDENYKERLHTPRFVQQGETTAQTFADTAQVLEINSKSGLYPLYVAYTMYRKQVDRDSMTWMITDTALEDRVKRHQQIWDKVLENNLFIICKTPMAKYITRRTLTGFREKVKVNVRYFEDLINQISHKQQKFIDQVTRSTYWNKKDNTLMKFTAIVGNPPYQEVKDKTSDTPIYHLFIDIATKLSNISTLITPARFLFNAGKTPKEWNERILNDEHFKVVWYKANSTEVFDNVDIKGGVCVSMYDKTQNFGKIGIYSPFTELNSIRQKVCDRDDFASLSDIIYPQTKFNLNELYKDHPECKGQIGSGGAEKRLTTSIFTTIGVFEEDGKATKINYRILGLIDNNRIYKRIAARYIEPNEYIDKYKVFVPKSNGSGAIGEVLSTPLIGEPLIGVTQSFIVIGIFDSKEKAKACLKYIKTKFARALLGILKVTQDNSKEVWRFVPIQDFTGQSDIDWNKSIADIDKQLYQKYNLSPDEIDFIERMIKPM